MFLVSERNGRGWIVVRHEAEGTRYGRLTVLRFGEIRSVGVKRICRRAFWECVCDCGNRVVVAGNNLRSGATRSCGCLQRDTAQQIGFDNKGRPSQNKGKRWPGSKRYLRNQRTRTKQNG